MRAVAARCSSRSPLSTPPRQPPSPALLRTRSSPGRLNSSTTRASSSPEVDSAAAYLASTFELSSTKTTANSQATTGTTKAGGATATTAFVGPSASSAGTTRSLKSSIYGKAFELLDDGTLVESVVDPFGSLSLNGTSVAVGASEVKGKGKAKEEAEEVETVSSEFNPTATRPKLKPRDQLKPKRATSTPAFASVTEPKPVHPFFSRTQSAPASQIRIPPAKQTDEAKMPKAPVQRKVSAGSLSPKLSGAGTKSVATSPPPRSRGSAGGSSVVRKARSARKSDAAAVAALHGYEVKSSKASSSTVQAEEEVKPKTKTATAARGRTKATRPKHVVDVSNFSTYTYKDPELALAYATVEVTPGAPEGEPERKPVEPMRWYITNADEAEDALTGLKGPVGFDMEWTVIFRRGVIPRKTALIQVADKTKIMLFHISRMSEFPRSLKRIIEDPSIVKTGVNITGDAKKLYGDWGIQAQGIVELAMLAWEVDKPTMQRHGFKTGWTTLANMVAMYTRRVLPKGAERTSDWEKPLNEEQLEYASNDAHCGLVIYNKLVAKAEEATIDLSKLRLNRMVEEGSEDTAPTANDDKAQEAEDAYAESVLASTSETQPQTEDQTEPEPEAASSSSARSSTRAPPCPSGVEYYRYRAYRMWYENPSLTLDEMCVRMRSAEQPLARTTVIGYVITTLECDTEKTLPFSKERLVELLREEPRSWQWNYKKITALGFTS